MAGVETRALNLRHRLRRDSARLHKGQGFANTICGLAIFLRPWRTAHIIMRPGVDLLKIGVAAVGKGAE